MNLVRRRRFPSPAGFRDLLEEHVDEIHVTGDARTCVDMPTSHSPSITNTGDDDLMALFWSQQIFDPARPDTYFQLVIKAQ